MTDTPKTGQDFAQAAATHHIAAWPLRDCSICGYMVGYVFDGENVGFDRGCDCTGRYIVERETWDDVAEHYNMQTHPDTIARQAAFWHFTSDV